MGFSIFTGASASAHGVTSGADGILVVCGRFGNSFRKPSGDLITLAAHHLRDMPPQREQAVCMLDLAKTTTSAVT